MLVRRDLEEYVSVPEGRIHFVKSGSGPPVVLLHPSGFSTWAWHTVMEPLGQHFACYAFDMLGHGQSDVPTGDFSIPDYACAVDHVMQVMNIHRAHVIGNATGAVVAVELAASYPDRIDRLVLAGTPVRDHRTAAQRLKETAANYDENGIHLPRTLDALKAAAIFTNPRPEWVDKMNEMEARSGVWMRRALDAVEWYSISSRLPLIRAAATLVLYGEYDHARDGEGMLGNNIVNATKVVLPGLGHVPQIEDPQAFVGAVLPFLK